MKVLVVIPAFNEAKSIANVLIDLSKHGYKNVVVIDDGSQDDTAKITRKSHVVVLLHAINRGLGAALGTAFEYGRRASVDILVTFDADGQHQAKDIKKIIAEIENNRADVVIGSRLLWQKSKMPTGRLILNYISNIATFILYRVWATDTLSGLRAFNKKALKCIKIKTQRMEVSNEFFKEIHRNKLRYQEVAIKPIYTDYSQSSSSQGQFPKRELRLAATMILRLFR